MVRQILQNFYLNPELLNNFRSIYTDIFLVELSWHQDLNQDEVALWNTLNGCHLQAKDTGSQLSLL
jgi:hypothetical protein